MSSIKNNDFMSQAAAEAARGVRKGDGGPFGAVIVRKGKVIAKAHNQVLRTNDPTSHAEISAIRLASKRLKRFDLSDCEIYTSSEPCPMCLAAIYWARIDRMYYGCTRDDAQKIGFDDKRFYKILEGKSKSGKVIAKQLGREECLVAFRSWDSAKGKKRY